MGLPQVAKLVDHALGTFAAKVNGSAVQPAEGALSFCPPPAPSSRLEEQQGINLTVQRTLGEPLKVVAEFGVRKPIQILNRAAGYFARGRIVTPRLAGKNTGASW